ncbi:MAG: hypothetical protein HY720_25580 [Planctomycetes bacterium]|nr:hypothetical protein [Planctomycetota bacterium]
MDHLTCDRCGGGLLLDEDVRYEVKIEVKAAYDVLELTAEDIQRDHTEEIRRLQEQAARMTEQELEDQVYKVFHLDLCATCQKRYIRDPFNLTPGAPQSGS